MTTADGPKIRAALEESRRLGFLGERPVDEVIAHAQVFVRALRGDAESAGAPAPSLPARIVDLGAGGGVPGLVIAEALPEVLLTMVDRRAKRTDFLERVVRRLRWNERVEVRCLDVARLIERTGPAYDAAVARGFGPPELTLRYACRLVRPGGTIVISEPPHGDRWDDDLLRELGVSADFVEDEAGRVVRFRVESSG